MTWEISLTLLTVFALFVLFIRQDLETEVLALGAVAFLLLTGILNTQELLSVFSNSAAMTVAAMFVLSAALEKTGVIDVMGRAILKMAEKHIILALFAIFLGVFIGSFFINNTSVVLIMIPIMIMISKKLSLSSSKLLLPLSYVSILGGTCTLIGTSTNLLVDGVAQHLGQKPFGVFEMLIPGLCMAFAGVLYLLLFGRHLLPSRQTLSDVFDTRIKRKYLSQIIVKKGSNLIGKALSESGFTRNEDFEIVRHISSPKPRMFGSIFSQLDSAQIFMRKIESHEPDDEVNMDAILQEGDRLIIMSSQRNILTVDNNKGISLLADEINSDHTVVMEGIIAPQSNFSGVYVDVFNKSNIYNAQIIALHRQNDKLSDDFGITKLAVGDTVLIKGDDVELLRIFENHELINLSKPEHEPFHKQRAPIALFALFAVIGLATANLFPIAGGAFIAAIVVIITRCITLKDAYKSMQGSVLFLIYAMLAISVAMQKTGALQLIIDQIMLVAQGLPPYIIISILYLLTSIITEFFSNNAAAVMLTPIAIGIAQQLGVDPRPFVVAIMFGASASFATPVGYQTNTLVFNAGGYKFQDFLKVGVPLNLILWIVASFIIPMYWGI